MDDAVNFLKRVRHASGQNYILSAPGSVRCFECSAGGVSEYVTRGGLGRLCHTNHPLVSDDLSPVYRTARDKDPATVEAGLVNSRARLKSIENRLVKPRGPVSLDTVKAALAAHDDFENPVSRTLTPVNGKNPMGFTAGAFVYEYGERPVFHVASGPACQTPFRAFTFDR